MKRIIAANWKMNMLREQARELAEGIVSFVSDIGEILDIVLAPPFTSLGVVSDVIRETPIQLSAQNVFWKSSGAFTGEVSPDMLVDSGCGWVIIGHSERRNIFHETDEMVRKKIEASLGAGLNTMVCVGETSEQRENGDTEKIVLSQVESALEGLEWDNSRDIVIAYEPIWAIGTGKNAEPGEVSRIHVMIKAKVRNILDSENSGKIRVVYGGSVNVDNAGDLFAEPDVDGSLVGGASLKADSFAKIVKLARD